MAVAERVDHVGAGARRSDDRQRVGQGRAVAHPYRDAVLVVLAMVGGEDRAASGAPGSAKSASGASRAAPSARPARRCRRDADPAPSGSRRTCRRRRRSGCAASPRGRGSSGGSRVRFRAAPCRRARRRAASTRPRRTLRRRRPGSSPASVRIAVSRLPSSRNPGGAGMHDLAAVAPELLEKPCHEAVRVAGVPVFAHQQAAHILA